MKSGPIRFTTRIDTLRHLVGMRYLLIPSQIVKKLGGSFSLRVICTVNDSLSYHGGLVALGNGDAYISINQARMKKLGVSVGDEVTVELTLDNSKYGMQVPQELEEYLRQDPEGDRRFHQLAPGKQRYIIQYVSTVKSPQLRIDRAIMLITNLKKLPLGKESFRQMLGKP